MGGKLICACQQLILCRAWAHVYRFFVNPLHAFLYPLLHSGHYTINPNNALLQGKSLNITINLFCSIPSKMGPLLYDPCVFSLVSLVSIVPLVFLSRFNELPLENLAIDQHDLRATMHGSGSCSVHWGGISSNSRNLLLG